MSKNLTDNEIKKALECCMKICKDCNNCPYMNDDYINVYNCKYALLKYVLDLINRLQSENERLSKITRPLIAEIKAEAYTECIAKVKEKSKKTEIVCSGALVTTDYAISKKTLTTS